MNLGGPEILVVILVALVVLGPEQLPKVMRTVGSVMSEVRKVSGGFQAEMRKAMDSVDVTGKEKPQSAGGPASQRPTTSDTVDAGLDDDALNEVVGRNESEATDAEATDAKVQAGDVVADAGVESAPSRPAIDPADRAAG